MDRRQAITGIGALAAAGALCGTASAIAATRFKGIDHQHLWVRQVGRPEAMHVRFRTHDGWAVAQGVYDLSWLFRDWRDSDSAILVDISLFDVLARMQTLISARAGKPIEIVLNSGYRTYRRNRTIEGAAVNSQHIQGRAADITATNFPVSALARIAGQAGAHGIGKYPSFLHVDVGPKGRRW